MHPLEIQRLQEIEVEIGEIGNVIEPGRVVRLAKTRMLRSEYRKALRQLFEKSHPAGMAASAVQEHDGLCIRCSRAAAQYADRCAIERDHFRAMRHTDQTPYWLSLDRALC